jgi:hypothetical protein
MSAARGTRRPHPSRVYKRGRKPSRSSGGGKKGKGCAVLAFALLAPPTVLAAFDLNLIPH